MGRRREKKTYRLTIRLSERERLKLSRLADAKGTTMSGAIHRYLARLTVGAEALHAEEEALYQVREASKRQDAAQLPPEKIAPATGYEPDDIEEEPYWDDWEE